MYKFIYASVYVFLFLVTPVYGEVVVNEVAWMGTVTSSSDEWIELHNTGDVSVDLDGWTLSGASLSIPVSGSIPAGGFFMLERTDDTTLPSIQADQIYSGALSNVGDVLFFKNEKGTTVDLLSFSDGWPAGDNTTKQTMQRAGNAWITAFPTPKSKTVSTAGTENTQSNDAEEEIVTKDQASTDTKQKEIPRIAGVVSIQDRIMQGIDTKFSATVYGYNKEILSRGYFLWNFGDGTFVESLQSGPVHHRYLHPGVYVISFAYYQSQYAENPEFLYRKTVSVVSPSVTINRILEDGSIELSNTSEYEINLSGFYLEQGLSRFVIPRYTFVPSRAKILLSPQGTKFSPEENTLVLKNPSNEIIASYPNNQKQIIVYTPSKNVQNKNTQIVPGVSVVQIEETNTDELPQNKNLQSASVAGTLDVLQGNDKYSGTILPLIGLFVLVSTGGLLGGMLFYRLRQKKSPDESDDFKIHEIKD